MMKEINKKVISLLICAVMTVGVSGCAFSDDFLGGNEQRVSDDSSTDNKVIDIVTTQEGDDQKTEASTESRQISTETETSSIPDYSGEAYIELNNNIPAFTDEEKKNTEAFELYSDLDKLGRCGVAFANICEELMPTEERGEIGEVRPSGWHTVKYPELIEDNYLFNRSHLIAFSLAGENANEKNLITGTRYMNQEIMQIFELKVLYYVRGKGNHVLYRVTPIFEGDNLVAKGVQMEAWSVEDDGEGICFNVFCYNIQPGIEIDYATGDSKLAESGTETEFEKQKRTYVLNTNTRKIHMPDCKSVSDMVDHNKLECESTLVELKEKGYSACNRCLSGY